MNKFFRKLERFFINVVVITLIILIGFQILMKDDVIYQRIKDFEMTFKQYFNSPETIQVTRIQDENKGYITVDLLNDLSLPQVWLIVNGERVSNFSSGIVTISVKEGDSISIDSSFYSQPLWFEITFLSSDISSWQVGQQFRLNNNQKRLGIVHFYEKL